MRHSPNIKQPDIKRANGVGTIQVLEQFQKLISEGFRNIFDDLMGLSVGRSAALPTAGKDYLGRFWLKENSSAEDTLHICIYDGSVPEYTWKEITLT